MMAQRISDSCSRITTVLATLALVIWISAGPAEANWQSSASGSATAKASTLLAPTSLSATCNILLGKSVTLTWSAANAWASYEVRWGTANGGPYGTSSGTITGTTYSTPALSGTLVGTAYYFVVRSVKGSFWLSATSNQASKTISTLACA
jgi:hypothetical protein